MSNTPQAEFTEALLAQGYVSSQGAPGPYNGDTPITGLTALSTDGAGTWQMTVDPVILGDATVTDLKVEIQVYGQPFAVGPGYGLALVGGFYFQVTTYDMHVSPPVAIGLDWSFTIKRIPRKR